MAGARYLRYIAFALFCLTLIFFISSTSTSTQVTEHIQSTTNALKDRWKDGVLPAQKPKIPKSPSFDVDEELHNIPTDDDYDDNDYDDDSQDDPRSQPDIKSGDFVHTQPQKELTTPKKPKKTTAGKMNATFVTLARNTDLWNLVSSINDVEDRFNHRFNYDWVFLNDEEFDDEFKKVTSNLVSGRTRYGLIPEKHWSFPSWIDQKKAARVREEMKKKEIIYGDSISYRHMCRFESGFFFQQPLMLEYEWYWRVEPDIKLYCDIDYDVFKYMADNDKKYSFVLSLFEYVETIPTLWDSVKKFMNTHPEHIAKDNSLDWLSEDGGESYNHCHFWSNFEIGNLEWLRSKAYTDFFNSLDRDGGFFYERWGDAPVHSIAAALLLQKDQIHFFEDIGYWHVPFHHCPREDIWKKKRCSCDPSKNFDWGGYSCLARFYDLHGWDHPEQED